jgi:hypothetical protein
MSHLLSFGYAIKDMMLLMWLMSQCAGGLLKLRNCLCFHSDDQGYRRP